MRILFLQSITYPFIGIMSMSAVLRRGEHHTKVHILNLNRPSPADFKTIRDYQPDLAAFPTYTGWQSSIIKFCGLLKDRMNVTTVLGGAHPTHRPEIVRSDVVDFICVGEGEISFPGLVDALEAQSQADNIPGIWLTKENQIIDNGPSPLPDLQKLPLMDIDLYCKASKVIRRKDNREFSLNRGCLFSCTYCNSPSLRSLYGAGFLRSKTADQAIEELLYVYERYPYRMPTFTSSDNLFHKKEFASEFLEKYKREIDLPFFCQMRVEFIDADIARMLREAGCHMVAIGVESGSPRVRKEILNRHMSNEKIIQACRYLQKENIKVTTTNMMGIPGETFDEAWETVRLNAKMRPAASWCSIFQPYPGTPLTRTLLESGGVTPEVFEKVPASFFETSILPIENVHRFINLQRFFQLAVLSPRLETIIRKLCNIKITKLFDVFFLWGYYRYVRIAYRESRLKAFSKIIQNALEALTS